MLYVTKVENYYGYYYVSVVNVGKDVGFVAINFMCYQCRQLSGFVTYVLWVTEVENV